MNINMDKVREISGIINRRHNITGTDVRTLMELYTPPMKVTLNPKEYHYPAALSGLHTMQSQPKVVLSGETSGNIPTM